jgi:5-formyltetrahydrofolate cyclo-ligase
VERWRLRAAAAEIAGEKLVVYETPLKTDRGRAHLGRVRAWIARSACLNSYAREVDSKQEVRERVWQLLEREGAARFPGARGRIPNFRGAEQAAARLAELAEWESAHVVKANPDAPQLPVRRRARMDGKTLYMAVPRLAAEKPFVEVRGDPTIRRALKEGRPVSLNELEPVDLIVCGTVAVNRQGVRVGKGGGFSDLEFALLAERRLVGVHTTIVTTVHPLQLLDERLPETDHDFRVDMIVTPNEVVRTRRRRRPPGILADHLDAEKRAAIPVLHHDPV